MNGQLIPAGVMRHVMINRMRSIVRLAFQNAFASARLARKFFVYYF